MSYCYQCADQSPGCWAVRVGDLYIGVDGFLHDRSEVHRMTKCNARAVCGWWRDAGFATAKVIRFVPRATHARNTGKGNAE